MMLADMGAEVIKVERPGTGDDARHWGPPFLGGHALWFLSVNRNKQSITLDFLEDDGRAVLHDLVRSCDVFVCNHIPRVQKKLGISEEDLRLVNDALVHVSITGFGLTGERRNWTCYDLIAEGYSGVMDLTGEFENDPQKVGTPAADMLAGMDAAFATMAALYAGKDSGTGCGIDISMIESMTRFLTPRIVSWLGSGELPRRSGGRDSVIAIYQTFQTADEPLTLGLGNDNLWARFWKAVGEPDRGADERFDSNIKRRERREEIVETIQNLLSTRERNHWLSLFAEHRIPAGPINRLDELTEDTELADRGLFYSLKLEGYDDVLPQVGTGIRFNDSSPRAETPPPRLGEHTDHVLGKLLGYDDARIQNLRSAKLV